MVSNITKDHSGADSWRHHRGCHVGSAWHTDLFTCGGHSICGRDRHRGGDGLSRVRGARIHVKIAWTFIDHSLNHLCVATNFFVVMALVMVAMVVIMVAIAVMLTMMLVVMMVCFGAVARRQGVSVGNRATKIHGGDLRREIGR